MKLSKRDLHDIYDLAHATLLELSPKQGGLNQQEFVAKCFLIASKKVLGITEEIEFPVKSLAEPVED